MKYELVLFDLDGTLVNTIYAISKIINMTMEDMNLRKYSVEETGKYIGYGVEGIVQKIFENERYDTRTVDSKEMLEKIRKYYRVYYNYYTELYEGIDKLLDFLTENSIKMGIVTNKVHEMALDTVQENLSKWNFIEVIGERDTEYPRKPHPYGIDFIASKYNIPKNKILFIGDMAVDVKTAENAGVDIIYCKWGFGAALNEEGINENIKVSNVEGIIEKLR